MGRQWRKGGGWVAVRSGGARVKLPRYFYCMVQRKNLSRLHLYVSRGKQLKSNGNSVSEGEKARPTPLGAPSPWIVAHGNDLAPGSRVLDLACGRGRHARYLAARGLRVVAADQDREALASLEGIPGIQPFWADLEGAPWPWERDLFDALVVSRYLHRPLLPHLAPTLKPGGILLYETFMVGQEALGRPRRTEHLLQPGELGDWALSAGLVVEDFQEGPVTVAGRPQVLQRLCARRPL